MGVHACVRVYVALCMCVVLGVYVLCKNMYVCVFLATFVSFGFSLPVLHGIRLTVEVQSLLHGISHGGGVAGCFPETTGRCTTRIEQRHRKLVRCSTVSL